jgi:hypothetical protein
VTSTKKETTKKETTKKETTKKETAQKETTTTTTTKQVGFRWSRQTSYHDDDTTRDPRRARPRSQP